MADSLQSEPSSRGDPLDNLESVLVDMTGDLIPGYITEIHDTDSSELETVLSQLVTTALTTPLKDKALTKMLGSMAVVMAAQLKHSHKLLEQAAGRVKTYKEEATRLQVANNTLTQTLDETKQSLAEAERHIVELKSLPLASSGDDHSASSEDEEKAQMKSKSAQLESSLQQRETELAVTESKLERATRDLNKSENLLRRAAEAIKKSKCKLNVKKMIKSIPKIYSNNL